ncbi:MAG: pyridoxal-phosphate dependent enzyme [Xanthomonadales bacterium]|nr:pyridoxal-phosphate dependent enzyme [Xanthomonadales bacterium]
MRDQLSPDDAGLHMVTPLIAASERLHLKMECFQPTGSFKIRGIGHMCEHAVAEGCDRLVSSSGGNAGIAVAYAGIRLGVAVTVLVPESTPEATRARLRDQGAEVMVRGAVWDETDLTARELAEQAGCAYVPPFDHPAIWEGHATLVDELRQQGPKPDAVVVSVGGGGLLCGVVQGLHQNGWDHVPVVAVETRGAESLYESIRAGEVVTLPAIQSVAKSLGALRVADQALECTRRHDIRSVVVDDQQALEACVAFADQHRVLVEPACGAALAGLNVEEAGLAAARTVVVVVCGGIGVSLDDIIRWRGAGIL